MRSDYMELIQVTQQLLEANQRLSKATKEVFKMARERAQTEKVYRMELAKQMTRLRIEGVQATLIPDIARGNIAELKEQRDLAKELHRSAIQSIQALQVEIQAWQSVLRNYEEL